MPRPCEDAVDYIGRVHGGIEAEVRKMVDDATEACKAAPVPPVDIMTTDVYADGGWAWRN